MKMIYYAGGPGMNGYPEAQLLTDLYATHGIELLCWNEPSKLRPLGYPYRATNAFQNYLDSAEAFFLEHYEGQALPVFAFCFGNQALTYILNRHQEKVSKALVVTPDYNFKEAFRNMFRFVADDYRLHGQEAQALRLEEIIPQCEGIFTEIVEEGFALYAGNPRFINYYFIDTDARNKYTSYFAKEGFGIDEAGFFDTCRSRFHQDIHGCPVPAVVVYGKYDQIITIPLELAHIKECYSNWKIFELESGHYPHLEKREDFLDIVLREFVS